MPSGVWFALLEGITTLFPRMLMKQKGGVFEKGGREGDKSGRKARVWVG
jgi:hypothetical protein